MRCPACNASVEYGQDLCAVCQAVVDDLNNDLHDRESPLEDHLEYVDTDVDSLSEEDRL